jgi:hypothetical protein
LVLTSARASVSFTDAKTLRQQTKEKTELDKQQESRDEMEGDLFRERLTLLLYGSVLEVDDCVEEDDKVEEVGT